MTEKLLKYYLRNFKKDLKILKDNKFRDRTKDLMVMVLSEDVPEIVKFVRNVVKVIDYEPYGTGDYCAGYKDALNDIRRRIYK